MSDLKIKMMSPEDRWTEGEIGEVRYNADANQYWLYTENGWQQIPDPDKKLELKLIDLNKQIISQIEDYNEEDFANAMNIIDEYATIKPGEYYMLLCRDYNYYTLFKTGEETYPSFSNEVIECLKNIGPVKAFDITDDKEAIEIWVMVEDEPYVMYLFNYDQGVVKCL